MTDEQFHKEMERQQHEADMLIELGTHDICYECGNVVPVEELKGEGYACQECR